MDNLTHTLTGLMMARAGLAKPGQRGGALMIMLAANAPDMDVLWSGLPGGRQIEFGGCKDPGDEQAYRGRPADLIVFDEADQFTEDEGADPSDQANNETEQRHWEQTEPRHSHPPPFGKRR